MKPKLSYEEQKASEEAGRKLWQENNARLIPIIKPLQQSTHAVDHEWGYIEKALQRYAEDYEGLDLNPDFQRGHVWTPEQQVHYVENALRGIVSQAAFVIQLNCPNWENEDYEGDLPRGFQCIDGLQRLTAILKLMNGEIKPFGLTLDDLARSSFSVKRGMYRFRTEVYTFQNKADLLQHYLDLNTGGTPHSQEEIERVRAMREQSVKGE